MKFNVNSAKRCSITLCTTRLLANLTGNVECFILNVAFYYKIENFVICYQAVKLASCALTATLYICLNIIVSLSYCV